MLNEDPNNFADKDPLKFPTTEVVARSDLGSDSKAFRYTGKSSTLYAGIFAGNSYKLCDLPTQKGERIMRKFPY